MFYDVKQLYEENYILYVVWIKWGPLSSYFPNTVFPNIYFKIYISATTSIGDCSAFTLFKFKLRYFFEAILLGLSGSSYSNNSYVGYDVSLQSAYVYQPFPCSSYEPFQYWNIFCLYNEECIQLLSSIQLNLPFLCMHFYIFKD